MKISTFIKREADKYRSKVITNKRQGVNLDKLEILSRSHTRRCIEFIETQELGSYKETCDYEIMARNAMEDVDKEMFGCYNDKGQCVGYDFYGRVVEK